MKRTIITSTDCEDKPRLPVDHTLSTPLCRVATSRLSQTKTFENFTEILPMPLRSSSCRYDKENFSNQKSDIRHHFPIRNSINRLSYVETDNVKAPDNNVDSPLTTSCNMNTSLSSVDSIFSFGGATRKRQSSSGEIDTKAKQSRYTESQKSVKLRNDKDTICLTMGAEVKAHPRYNLRKNALDADINEDNVHNSKKHLAPICPVPMPSGFPLQLPIRYSSVSLPWEMKSDTRFTSSRTVETQTSPTRNNQTSACEKPRGRRHTGLGLRNSATVQVLQNLKRKFSHLRRAISADRINKSSSTPSDTRESSNCNYTSLPRNPDQSTDLNIQQNPEATPYKLTCKVVRQNPDGSIQISLRRSSINGQFGFFIARDSKGIYVTRLGSVRCAAKLWDVFHVGDRILEVQGLSCDNLDVEEIRNLIRGCELVEFKIKPCSHTDSNFSRKHSL
ncbi:hypothetical protein MS3_00001453 [Schistosoma haematobium]|uniref:PDZ domain-containing protein n=1 Tax=Schistosoma haematobium TaxID=6185 RepID=A0A922LX60_SCHHA|nr:hypothetical protein MS3_00001453 [Schistosoma haematobium]KAH9595389.1 hypothetical protein MS3_00001453 [Schistosoma haematobium]